MPASASPMGTILMACTSSPRKIPKWVLFEKESYTL
jgi:hypothetical protein